MPSRRHRATASHPFALFLVAGVHVALVVGLWRTSLGLRAKPASSGRSTEVLIRLQPPSRPRLVQLLARVGWQKAVVALSNKNARIVWALLAKGRVFDPNYVSVKPGTALAIPGTATA